MAEEMDSLKKRIAAIEKDMSSATFWEFKDRAQATIKEYNELKERFAGLNKYDKGGAIITIFSGAGGDDAEDFSRILYEMYERYFGRRGWESTVLHENKNDHGGYRNITFEVTGKGVYGTLKNESGVHRLVRKSPFSAKKLRHTSFSMVEVIPKIAKKEIDIADADLEIHFTRSSGPGGQNVNKRETAVRLTHIPTNITVHSDSERTQESNREKALEILKGKLYRRIEDERESEEGKHYVSKTTEVEWGNQIRSYVLHPYQMVKDHRTEVEVRDIDSIFQEGDIDKFIEAEENL